MFSRLFKAIKRSESSTVFINSEDDGPDDITDFLQNSIDNNSVTTLPEGEFILSRTIVIGSNKIIKGQGERTVLKLGSAVNANMFTNKSHKEGNSKITIENLLLDGNLTEQYKPEDEKRLSFCNLVYFSNTKDVVFNNITGINCFQTVLHFNNCDNVQIEGLLAKNLGWSGISTSGTNNIKATKIRIFDSGKDHRHSAIHLDGGKGAYIEADIDKCVGNGVMIDATFSPFSHAVVKANCSNCMRGISLIGSEGKMPRNILIQGGEMKRNKVGVMISNASHSFIDGACIENNTEVGLLFQGRIGGNENVITNCTFLGNKKDVDEIHESKNNIFFENEIN